MNWVICFFGMGMKKNQNQWWNGTIVRRRPIKFKLQYIFNSLFQPVELSFGFGLNELLKEMKQWVKGKSNKAKEEAGWVCSLTHSFFFLRSTITHSIKRSQAQSGNLLIGVELLPLPCLWVDYERSSSAADEFHSVNSTINFIPSSLPPSIKWKKKESTIKNE